MPAWICGPTRRVPLCGLAGEVEGGRGACRVKLSEAAHGLAGGQRLYGHAPLLQLLDHFGIGPHAAVGASAHDQMRRKLVQDLDQVVEHQRMAIFAPPIPYHPVGQDDEVLGLLAPVDDNPPELIPVDPRHPTAPQRVGRLVAPGRSAGLASWNERTARLLLETAPDCHRSGRRDRRAGAAVGAGPIACSTPTWWPPASRTVVDAVSSYALARLYILTG